MLLIVFYVIFFSPKSWWVQQEKDKHSVHFVLDKKSYFFCEFTIPFKKLIVYYCLLGQKKLGGVS